MVYFQLKCMPPFVVVLIRRPECLTAVPLIYTVTDARHSVSGNADNRDPGHDFQMDALLQKVYYVVDKFFFRYLCSQIFLLESVKLD